MLIDLPPEINNKTFATIANLAYVRSFSEPHCLFDWTKIEWVGLPEVVRILNWSAKLVASGTKVQWAIWEPHRSCDRLDALRPLAAEVLGPELFRRVTNKIEKLDRQTQDGVLSKSEFSARQNSIFETVKNGGYSKELVHEWLALEMQRFRRLEVLTYLQRYKLISNAIAAGVQVDPPGRNIPRYKLAPKPDSACLALEPIQSKIELRSLVDRFNDPNELARILGDFAGLDVARGGALAGILVTELGGNIEDHAQASAAWICTRLVLDINVARQTLNDLSTTSFRTSRKGFLEIIVCDNGCGLTENLRTVLLRDKRISVSNKYSSQALPSEVQLIDYAFDRLSSTKRDISQLIHLEESAQQSSSTTHSFVSSGLYWVWNVVRSHRGVLSVETGGFRTWYDFTEEATETYGWRLIYPKFEKSIGLRCGTLIRICLPLADSHSYKERRDPIRSESDLVSKSISSQNFFFTWVGELTTSVPLKPRKPATYRRAVGMERLPGISDDHSMRLLQELHQKHLALGDGDVLILDLCGVRTEWAKHSVVPLCQFVLEMNYTSTVGRSAVVLWNVPASSMQIFELAIRLRDLFEKNLENANRKHSQLREFRRAVLMVFDDEQIRIFCGWKEAEDILSRLRQDADLDLDEIGAARLSDRDNLRLKKLITENSHLFEWKGNNRVQLRIWPRGIRIAAWREGLAWLKLLLERDVLDQGVRLTARNGYFRLPSTGQLVKVFYQFRGLLADHEACAKLAWLIAQVVSAIEARRIDTPKPALHMISVSRSTMSLACHLRDNYYYDIRTGVSSVFAERTIEELEAAGGSSALKGDAILITDVLSSGHLCDRIARAFPRVTWISTIALLDTRDATPEKTVQLHNGIDLFEGPKFATGTIYALAIKKVPKLSPAEVGDAQIHAIDEVNVCAVEPFEERGNTEGKFWEFADRKPDALKVGHYVGNNHHYIYKVDVGELLTAPNEDGQTLMSVIVHRVESDLRKKHYSPDNTVIMHPPHDHSHAEKIARAVQLNTGVLYRHILYKDNFAGHWRFSAFVHHGVPLKRSTLVLIDDGTNSGETLMGLLDAATFGNPHDVLAYVGVTRMPPHKNHLFTSLKNLRSITGNVKVQFFLELSIPVYAPRECPICRLITTLAEIAENNPLIRRYAQILRSQILPRTSHDNGDLPFLWKFSSVQTVTKLREDLETLDYHVPASSHVYSELERAVDVNNREAKENLLDLAFIVCSEPDWASATVFAPYLDSRERGLVEASLKCVRESSEDNLMTFLGFAYHLLLRSHQRMPSQDFAPDLAKFWRSLFSRSDITTEVFGKIIAFILAEAAKEKLTEPEKPKFGHKLLHELKAQVNPRSITLDRLNHRAISMAFAYLFVREALTPSRELRMRGFVDTNAGRPDLFELAKRVASKFWWHSSDYIKTNISLLRDAVVADTPSTQDRLYGPIHSLVVSFDDLYELKERMEEADRKSREETGEILGTQIYWETPELNDSIAKFMRSLVEITEESGVGLAEFKPQTSLFVLDRLSSTWDQLTSHLGLAFEELFPEVQAVIERIWGDFANLTDLPESIAEPLHIGVSVSRTHRVFMPRTLLFKFLDAALDNLRTSAFSGWTAEDLLKKAQARIELDCINEQNEKTIILRVIDNGPTEPREPRAGQGRGLKNVRLMARHFAADVIGPDEKNGETYVELRMKSRESGDRE